MINASLPFEPANISSQDQRPVKGVKHDDSLFASKRIEFRQPIIIQNLEANTALDINFANKLGFDCLVRGMSADILDDDGNQIQSGTERHRFSYVQIIIQTLDKDTNYVLRTVNLYITSYPGLVNEMVLSPNYIYRIKANQTIKTLAFSCEPLIQGNPIVIYPTPVTE